MRDKTGRTIKPLAVMANDMAQEVEQGKRTKDIYKVQSGEYKREVLAQDLTRAIDAVSDDKRVRVNFNSLDDVRLRIGDYFRACSMAGVYPTVAGLASHGFGVSRQAVNQYLLKNPDTEVTKLIHTAYDMMTDVLVNGGLSNNANQIMAIFELKNQHGYRDRVEVQPVQPSSDIESVGVDELREKYLDTGPDES